MPEDQQTPSTAELAENFHTGLRWLLNGIAFPG